MAQRRHHYEQAFESYLRHERIPYVAVNEARKALVPAAGADAAASLKSFDFVVYGAGLNLLAEVKGRRLPPRSTRQAGSRTSVRRLESWVHADDVSSMLEWERLFGPEFKAVFIFLYWCDELPGDGLFEEIIEHRNRWYALRAVGVAEYQRHMRVRSPRWGTVHLDAASFGRLSHPFRGSLSAAESPLAGTGAIGSPAPALEPLHA